MSDPTPPSLSLPVHDPALRNVAMPSDTNPGGDIFGGWILGQMDLAGGITAVRFVGGRVVTVAVEGITFHLPVFVGDEVSCYAHIVKVGRTSLHVNVEVWVRRRYTNNAEKVTEGVFVYVNIGDDRKPKPIGWTLEN